MDRMGATALLETEIGNEIRELMAQDGEWLDEEMFRKGKRSQHCRKPIGVYD